jgi:hypothetical protein
VREGEGERTKYKEGERGAKRKRERGGWIQ